MGHFVTFNLALAGDDVSENDILKELAKTLGLKRIDREGESAIHFVFRNGKELRVALDDPLMSVWLPDRKPK